MSAKRKGTEIPLLLTSSVVAHDKSVRLTNTDERVRLAMESIAKWLKINPTLRIVLCDGSSFDFSNMVHHEFPKAHIECLPFENDQESVRHFGRGYGEGEIVRYAINHSKFITQAGCFAKCSSKLWVENFFDCIEPWNDRFLCKGVFLDVFNPFRKTVFSYIDTRFYVADVAFYREYFENSHKRIGMRNGTFFSLENCFHEVIQEMALSRTLLHTSPIISGIGGGIGRQYKTKPFRRFKDDLRLTLVRLSKVYASLFAQHT